jgi:16S rRNA pseudouridine516 synthase
MRLDKFIANLWYGSRTQVNRFIKDDYIGVNGETVNNKDFEIKFWDIVHIGDEDVEYKEFVYVLLNKPVNYVSSKKNDWGHLSYLELLQNCPYSQIINIVGRLDIDTSGLMLLTNNWELTHKIISPKKDIFKKYKVTAQKAVSDFELKKLELWVKIDDFVTKPALVERISENQFYLSISEGKFHQIKKMLEAIANQVVNLQRLEIGNLSLWDLELWDWRYLTDEEVKDLETFYA